MNSNQCKEAFPDILHLFPRGGLIGTHYGHIPKGYVSKNDPQAKWLKMLRKAALLQSYSPFLTLWPWLGSLLVPWLSTDMSPRKTHPPVAAVGPSPPPAAHPLGATPIAPALPSTTASPAIATDIHVVPSSSPLPSSKIKLRCERSLDKEK